MKALKRKDSSDDAPVWGLMWWDTWADSSVDWPSGVVDAPQGVMPTLYGDKQAIETIEVMIGADPGGLDDYELVEVELKLKK